MHTKYFLSHLSDCDNLYTKCLGYLRNLYLVEMFTSINSNRDTKAIDLASSTTVFIDSPNAGIVRLAQSQLQKAGYKTVTDLKSIDPDQPPSIAIIHPSYVIYLLQRLRDANHYFWKPV